MKQFKAPLLAVGVVLGIVIIIGSIKVLQFGAMASMDFTPPPTAISVYSAEEQQWPSSIKAIGTVRSAEGITLMAELPGVVESIHFRSGDQVEAGTLLLKQDSGNEEAMLKAAQSQLRLAKYNFDQISKLRSQKTVSENSFQVAQQDLDAANANLQNITSSLDKKQIRARFSGVLGIRKVDLGQDLQGGTPIVDLYSYDNLHVDFTIPQRWLSNVKTGQQVMVNMIENKEQKVTGQINAVGASVNEITRSLEIQAQLNNVDNALLPGMAVEVEIELAEEQTHLVVPSTAIIYAPYGDTVFVIEKNAETGALHARQQFVQIAAHRGDFVAIAQGLKAGEQVASAGAFKLFNGQAVKLSDNLESPYSLNPTPKDS